MDEKIIYNAGVQQLKEGVLKKIVEQRDIIAKARDELRVLYDDLGEMFDKRRIDWLEQQNGFSLVSDDAGRWAVVTSGIQNSPDPDKPIEIETTFWITANEWKDSIREAIDAVMNQ